ncbi:MAG TPA: NADP-dependent oxidoreductase [Thermoleophilaceae bacterium]|nr:NADP-dependent oxidoreductase [Thermoleophilaceae bacterium]
MLSVVEVPRPNPISTEVLVEVHACGVNPVDWKTRSGGGVSAWAGPPPFVIGWDVAGVVVETGYGVTTLAPGDRVFGMPWFPREAGAYAEYVTAPSRQFARIPEGMPFEEAAALPLAALTAWQALVDPASVQSGQSVLINGASGGVGHLAVQIAKARGARVIGTARSANHDFLRSLGADECVDREAVEIQDSAENVDAVLDFAGRDHTRAELDTMRDGGVLVAIANGASDEAKEEAERRGIRVAEILVEPDGHALNEIAQLAGDGRLKVSLDKVLPLDQAAKAHELLEAGGVRGKLVLAIR